jgi:aminobenzoyl-glutamate transport protein
MSAVAAESPKTVVERFLAVVERAGNALPNPVTLFAGMAALVVVASALADAADLSAVHPSTGKLVEPVNLLTLEGLHRIMTGAVANFTGFAPLGTVLVALVGIGVAEQSGLMQAALRRLLLATPRALLTPVTVFAGVMSNMASDIGYVLLVPLAGVLFKAAGRHPILGMAAAFAGVSGGFSANLLLGTIDPLLAGISQESARLVDPTYVVNPAANYYLMAVSTPLITALGWWVTEKIVAPRWPDRSALAGEDKVEALTDAERRGLRWAGWTTVALTVVMIAGIAPEGGFLRKIGETGADSVLHSPLLVGVVSVIFVAGLALGVAYGIGAGTIRNDHDVVKGMSQQVSTLGGYIVLVFFAAQFVAFFGWTNLGMIFAVKGAELVQATGLGALPVLVKFILFTALVNLAMGSASAKWALMAPVFVPMFMLLGIPPETTQAAYRVGDSCTNIISPMMMYFVLIIAFIQRYEPKAGLGTVISTMLPYSVAFLIGWTLLFVLWFALDLPMGPGAPTVYEASRPD